MTVFVASGTSGKYYHTTRRCYQLEKAGTVLEKDLELIEPFYDQCGECEEWERKQ